MKISKRLTLLTLLLLLPLGFSPSFAEDEEEEARPITMTVRFFQTGALTSGRLDQYREAPPNTDLNDEDNPLFGGEAEEGWYPVGQVDELIELIKGNVSPAFWERTEGADIMACSEKCIVVRASAKIQSEIATFLAGMESEVCTAVTIDVQAAKLSHDQARDLVVGGKGLVLDAGRLERLLGDGAAGPSVTVTTFADSRAAVFSGMQRAYIADYDVEVAQGAKISSPQISVANLGLAIDVRPVLTPGNRTVRVSLNGFLTSLGTPATANTQDDRVLELPRHAIQVVHTEAVVTAGAWTLIDGETAGEGEGRWVFLLRATPAPHRARTAPKPATEFNAPIDIRSERSATRAFDIGDLGHGVHNRQGRTIHLWPTRYGQPEPNELPEPQPPFYGDALTELFVSFIAPDSWEGDYGNSIEVRSARMLVRNHPEVLDAIGKRLGALRKEFLWTVVADAQVVEVPSALARGLGRSEASGSTLLLSAADQKAIETAITSGDAKRMDSARVTSLSGARNAVTSGRRISYLADYAVEIAEDASIANPIVRTFLAGMVFDIWPSMASGRDSAQMEVRCTRSSTAKSNRNAQTPHGTLELPELDVFRVRTSAQIPFGRTAILGAAGNGKRTQVLLVTLQLQEQGR